MTRRRSVLWSLLGAALVALGVVPEVLADGRGARDAGSYHLVSSPARRIRAVLEWEIRCPRLSAAEWEAAAAAAPELPAQSQVSSALYPEGRSVREAGDHGRTLLCIRVPVAGTVRPDRLSLRVQHEATLWSRHLRPGKPRADAPAVPPLPPAERRRALEAAGLFDFNAPAFRRWLDGLDLQRSDGETDVDFARRCYRSIKTAFRYAFDEAQDRHASELCRGKASDCGGLSILFVSVLRARDVPARALVGRWALSSDDAPGKPPYRQEHVKAEFHAEGVGWVPVDLASAILYDPSAEGTRFFGNDDGDFLTLHVDDGLRVDTGLFGRQTIDILQGVAYWASGPGDFDGATRRESWRVETIPANGLRETTLRKRVGPSSRPRRRSSGRP